MKIPSLFHLIKMPTERNSKHRKNISGRKSGMQEGKKGQKNVAQSKWVVIMQAKVTFGMV